MENFEGLILAAAMLVLTSLFGYLVMSNRRNGSALLNWPMVGMLPSLLWNLSNFYEWTTALLNRNGGTIQFNAGFCTTNFQIITCSPVNLGYILDMSKSLSCFGEVEGSLEDAIALTLSRSSFDINLIQKLVGQRILPALDEACKKDAALDLQDLLLSFGLDYACFVALGLGKEDMGPLVPEFAKAFEEAMESWAYRLIRPTKYYCHKYMTALKQAHKSASKMVVECREKQEVGSSNDHRDVLSSPSFIMGSGGHEEAVCDKDVFISIVVGCRDVCTSALCWFLWLVGNHPHVEDKIMVQFSDKIGHFAVDELNGMQYLEAALYETMRLYPPFPLGHMRASEDMVLPDGTCVEKGSGILYLIYGANRMESIWGEDAMEFKPERWIDGGICVRKLDYCRYPVLGAVHMDMIKCLAVNILVRYHVTVEEEFPVEAKLGMSLLMKYGFKVTLYSREDELQAA